MILNRRAVEELSEKDLQEVFSGTVLMDTETFQLLAERFPQLTFTSAIRMKMPMESHWRRVEKHFMSVLKINIMLLTLKMSSIRKLMLFKYSAVFHTINRRREFVLCLQILAEQW